MVEKPRYILLPLIGILKERTLWIEGQILHLRNHHHPVKINESNWKNIIRVISAYLPGNTLSGILEINIAEEHHISDLTDNGFFKMTFDNLHPRIDAASPQYHLIRKDTRHKVHIPEHYLNRIFTYNGFKTGVISDIDDTILVSHTTNFLKKIRQVMIKNAYRRKAVSKMALTYRMFEENNFPLFYVSNSEANLYPLIHLFLKHNGFPEGPVFLKQYKKWQELIDRQSINLMVNHKKEKIQNIIDFFSGNDFILIGDDSQQDTDVYTQVASLNPGRIKFIFIRVTGKSANSAIQKKLDEFSISSSVPVNYFEDPGILLSAFNLHGAK
jgi:phosphatidate phosphatase APP1